MPSGVTVVAVVGAVGVTPDVGVVDGVGVFTGVCVVCGGTVVAVGVGVAVTVAVGVGVTVGGVTVGVGVSVAVTVGVGLVVTVGVAVGCCDGVAVGFGRGVAVGFTVGVARGRPDGPVVPVERRAVVFVPLARARSVLLATGVGEHTLTVAVMVAVVPAEATRAVAVREAALSNVFRGGPAYISLDHHVAPVIAKSRDILMQMSTKAKNTPRLRPPCPFLFQRTINISIMPVPPLLARAYPPFHLAPYLPLLLFYPCSLPLCPQRRAAPASPPENPLYFSVACACALCASCGWLNYRFRSHLHPGAPAFQTGGQQSPTSAPLQQ